MIPIEQKQQQNIIEIFLSRTIHIYGVTGAEGFAVLDWLQHLGHTQIIAHDFSDSVAALRVEWFRVHEVIALQDELRLTEILADEKITWLLGEEYAKPPDEGDIFFVTQSWFRYAGNFFLKPFFAPTLEVLPEFRDNVWTLTRLYFAVFPGKLIAVTGSDGKTTTTRMIGAIMAAYAQERGVRCIETGNDRTHVQSIADVAACSPQDFLVLEISDRQLSFQFPLIPDIAVVTNITSNKHIDDYGGFDKYVQVKGNLLRFQTKNQIAILNSDDEASQAQLVNIGDGAREWISLQRRPEHGAWCSNDTFIRTRMSEDIAIMKAHELGVLGRHNWYNALQALIATEATGVPFSISVPVLKKFTGVPHRLQLIRRWQRITFIEDSAGGNPANIAVTIQTFNKQPLVLIVGGYRPNLTLDEIIPIIHALDSTHTVKALLLFGQVAPKLKEFIEVHVNSFRAIEIVTDLPGAIAWVVAHAPEFTASQEAVVCMTPGFESFDQYKDYRARAEHFIQLVNELP